MKTATQPFQFVTASYLTRVNSQIATNLDELGRMSRAERGHDSAVRAFVSISANYPAFHAWLERQLTGRTLSTVREVRG